MVIILKEEFNNLTRSAGAAMEKVKKGHLVKMLFFLT
jgi:hypothetical protein